MGLIPFLTKKIEKWVASFPITYYLLRIYYKYKVEKEIKLASIKEQDRVLCIGGGSVPCTALEIRKKTGAKVSVVDVDPEAVENSRQLLERLSFSDGIEVMRGRGEEVDPSQFTLVQVALQACPQAKILANILSDLDEKTRILMRCPKCALKKVRRVLNQQYPACNFECREEKYGTGRAALLLITPERSYEDEKIGSVPSRSSIGMSSSLAG